MYPNFVGNYSTSEDEWINFITPWSQRVQLVVVFNLFNFFSIITNGLVIFLTLYTDLRHTPINLFIANLALSDFSMSALFVLGQNFFILYRESMPPLACSIWAYINVSASLQEVVFPPILAVNRYICLCHPHQYKKIYTKRNMFSMAVSSWLWSYGVFLIFALNGQFGYDRRNEHCGILADDDRTWCIAFWVLIMGPVIFLFNPIMVFCNLKIHRKLKTHLDQAGSMLKNNVVSENKEILYALIIDMLIPICTHTMYIVFKYALPNRIHLASRMLPILLFLGPAGFRGLVILRMLRPYRNAFSIYFCGKKSSAGNKIEPTPKSLLAIDSRSVKIIAIESHM